MNMSSILKIALFFVLSVAKASEMKPFLSLDAATLWAKTGYTQRLNLFNTLGNTYVADDPWRNNNTVMLGLGLRILNRDVVQLNTSLRLLPMTGMPLSGEVMQLHSPQFRNLAYHYDVHSTLLLVDNILTWNKYPLQPGLIVGLGGASNTTSNYMEVPLNDHATSALDNFKNARRTQWAYELGAVLDYAFKEVVFEFAYRFINAGRAQLGLNPLQTTLEHLSTGPLYYHTLSLGVRLYYGE